MFLFVLNDDVTVVAYGMDLEPIPNVHLITRLHLCDLPEKSHRLRIVTVKTISVVFIVVSHEGRHQNQWYKLVTKYK